MAHIRFTQHIKDRSREVTQKAPPFITTLKPSARLGMRRKGLWSEMSSMQNYVCLMHTSFYICITYYHINRNMCIYIYQCVYTYISYGSGFEGENPVKYRRNRMEVRLIRPLMGDNSIPESWMWLRQHDAQDSEKFWDPEGMAPWRNNRQRSNFNPMEISDDIRMYPYIYVYLYIHVYTHTRIHTYIHPYMHAYSYIQLHTVTYSYIQLHTVTLHYILFHYIT